MVLIIVFPLTRIGFVSNKHRNPSCSLLKLQVPLVFIRTFFGSETFGFDFPSRPYKLTGIVVTRVPNSFHKTRRLAFGAFFPPRAFDDFLLVFILPESRPLDEFIS